MNSFYRRRASWSRLAILEIWLIASCHLAWGEIPIANERAPPAGAEQSGGKDQPVQDQLTLPTGPPATIDGFRQARFGMSEEQVRQAIRKDFPAAAAKVTHAGSPPEKNKGPFFNAVVFL